MGFEEDQTVNLVNKSEESFNFSRAGDDQCYELLCERIHIRKRKATKAQ